MNRENRKDTDVIELSVMQILVTLLKKCWIIVLSFFICTASAYYISSELITPRYESTVLFYVNNASFASDNRISSSDLYASENLIDSYGVILTTRTTLDEAITVSGVVLDYEQALKMVSIRKVPDTTLFQVTVNGPEAQTVGKLAQGIQQVLPERINRIMAGVYTSVADEAQMPSTPATPKVMRNTISAAIFGVVFGASLILLQMMGNTLIRTDRDIPENWGIPVLTQIPAFKSKGNQKSKKKTLAPEEPVFHPEQAEAYKLLRTKLEVSFPKDKHGSVVSITSAMAGEGKSTTAVNLAYALAEGGHRVMLMDCDLRRPTIHKKLGLTKRPGITELLVKQTGDGQVIKSVAVKGGQLHVLTAGWSAPNPMELLSSAKMRELIYQMSTAYDYVVVDLPPVEEVGDALAVADRVDGFVLVARAGYCRRQSLLRTIAQLEEIHASVPGLVLNGVKN